ncbi:hypothetical protein Uis1B_2169 [Bifidobacterium margollesii]|uniref:Uncharacterized protein n=1 Tax=Bifidobacterium margollesii TaxID=2020964 RepID=A0A2N5J722_9BIFI|nr:hypothetical protein [Bifidobacterium margollesii]PLS29987.1 hypothetical protein Uis1B_2169 [Bifidobacterium margollesii]
MKDKEPEEQNLDDLLNILAELLYEAHRPAERDLDRIDGMIRSHTAGKPAADPDTWGFYAWATILDPVDRILDALGERRIREHLDPAHPMTERDLWMACRIWSRWTQIADRLKSLVEMIDGTATCESDKARFLLRRRLTELTDGTESGDFDRSDDDYWIPESGEWRDWRILVDMCVGDWMTPKALHTIAAMMSRGSGAPTRRTTEEDAA